MTSSTKKQGEMDSDANETRGYGRGHGGGSGSYVGTGHGERLSFAGHLYGLFHAGTGIGIGMQREREIDCYRTKLDEEK